MAPVATRLGPPDSNSALKRTVKVANAFDQWCLAERIAAVPDPLGRKGRR